MYFPKSQITPNLYTNGNEYTIKSTGKNYVGPYWKSSTGKFFTGKTPQDAPIQELDKIKYQESSPISSPTLEVVLFSNDADPVVYSELYNGFEIEKYTNLAKIDINKKIPVPVYSPALPIQQDYQIGEFRRYFCKKINEIIYLEINKDTFDKLVNKNSNIFYQLYQPFNIPWQLTGDRSQVYKTNKNIVELTMKQQKLPQFDRYLKEDYTKYYI